MFTIQPPLEVKEKVEHLAEEIQKILGLTNGQIRIRIVDRKVKIEDLEIMVKAR